MEEKQKKVSAKRIDIVQVKVVKEKSMLYKNRRVRSPQDAYEIIHEYLGDVDREHFVALHLNTKNEPTCIETVHIGSLNASVVHPRELMKAAIISNSAGIIVAHTHPSDDTTPSPEDIEVTERLVEAGRIIGIDIMDHLILASDSFRSLKESGYM